MNTVVLKTAKSLRRRQTPAERELWKHLRNRHIAGTKFLRQHPMTFRYDDGEHFFVADFCSHEARLVIEVDGGIHDDQVEYDQYRTELINQLGYSVIRFDNHQVLNDIKTVLSAIKDSIENTDE